MFSVAVSLLSPFSFASAILSCLSAFTLVLVRKCLELGRRRKARLVDRAVVKDLKTDYQFLLERDSKFLGDGEHVTSIFSCCHTPTRIVLFILLRCPQLTDQHGIQHRLRTSKVDRVRYLCAMFHHTPS